MVTTNQKSIIDIHTKKEKESQHNTKDSHQITREENKTGKRKKRKRGKGKGKRGKGKKKTYKNKSKTINKMAIRTYVSIITLNVNRLNTPPKDTDWLNEYKRRPVHMFSTRDPLQV